MGTAESHLMVDELLERLNKEDVIGFNKNYFQYFQPDGIQRLKLACSDFFQRHFSKGKPINPENASRSLLKLRVLKYSELI